MSKDKYEFTIEAPDSGEVTIWMATYSGISQIGSLPANMVPGSVLMVKQTRQKEFPLGDTTHK